MNVGDFVAYSHKGKGRAELKKQYDSPCLVYQVIGGWAYLLRLNDGGIHVVQNTGWVSTEASIPNHLQFIAQHLLNHGKNLSH